MGNGINKVYLALLTIVAALGGLLFGFDIAIITGAGPFIETHFHLENSQLGLGFSFASLLFGCMFGAAFAGRMTDLYGRKKILIYVAFLFSITSLLTAIASSFTMFISARFLGGLAVGAASVLSPMYIVEVSPAKTRGMLVSFYQFSIVFGILISYIINYLLRDTGPDNWRWMFMTGVFPSALFFGLLFLVPETPRFLFRIGKEKDAFNVLEKIGGHSMAVAEIEEIRDSLVEKHSNIKELLKPEYKSMILVSLLLAVFVQITGINAVVDFAPKIFISAGFTIDSALFATFGLGVTFVVFTFVSVYFIDRIGRRALYIIGSAGMSMALGILMYMSFIDHFSGLLVFIAIMSFLAFFAACIGPVFWTLVSEIFPNKIRGTAMIIPVVTQWFFNALVVWVFPEMLKNFKTGTFMVLAIFTIMQLIFAIKWLPETKGKSLEEIEKMWKKRSKSLQT